MGQLKDGSAGSRGSLDELDDPADDAPISLRHRPASEVRFPERPTPATSWPSSPPPPSSSRSSAPSSSTRFPGESPIGNGPTGVLLSDELRALLWHVVHSFLLAPHDDFDQWTSGVTGRPAVRRVWVALPIGGDPNRMPEDVPDLLERWFSLVDAADVFEFIESVHDNIETPNQQRFANACNAALERGCADRRFVARRLMPIASRTDVATVERALMSCKPAHMADVAERLFDALDRFAQKTNPDFRGAVQEAIRAVEEATFVLTGERPLSLDDALEDLEAKGLVDPAMKAAYGGLSAYVSTLGVRKTTQDDARLIIVMCAGFLSHLAAKM